MNNDKLSRITYAVFNKTKKAWLRKNGTYSPDFSHARLFTGGGHAKNSKQYRQDVRAGTNELLIIPIKIEVSDKELFARVLANKSV